LAPLRAFVFVGDIHFRNAALEVGKTVPIFIMVLIKLFKSICWRKVMPSRDPIGWMWAEACRMLDQAERLQREFFRLDFPRGTRVAWQPPVDVFENQCEFAVVVALPGVSPDNAEVKIDGCTLVIRARRTVSMQDRERSIERLEIPFGYFERRLVLPQISLKLDSQQWSDGCLMLTLRKTR
jgi:HSP20 family protein